MLGEAGLCRKILPTYLPCTFGKVFLPVPNGPVKASPCIKWTLKPEALHHHTPLTLILTRQSMLLTPVKSQISWSWVYGCIALKPRCLASHFILVLRTSAVPESYPLRTDISRFFNHFLTPTSIYSKLLGSNRKVTSGFVRLQHSSLIH